MNMHANSVGFVIIGRNEGHRLVSCLESIADYAHRSVYVDSGSEDDSIAEAQSRGFDVISLDMNIPFTAARARNMGWKHLVETHADLDFIHFIDGDCTLDPNWLPKALIKLTESAQTGLVCGQRKEIFPKASIYNTLCDIEWNTPVGESLYCGGDVLVRRKVLEDVSGYRDDVIAGEEPEMCVRARARGWLIFRLDAVMTHHDACIKHFSQWWKRMKRSGFAFALGSSIHGRTPERMWVSETRRALVWGLSIPIAILSLGIFQYFYAAMLLALIYPLQWIRLAISSQNDHSKAWAFFILIGKFAEALGVIKFYINKLLSKTNKIIEYK